MIYTIKTIIGRENVVMDTVANKAKVKGLEIKALARPEEIKGYIFIEGELDQIEAVLREIPHARGLLRNPVNISDLRRFLETKKAEIKLNKGDIIEVIGGPFKGEKGKVTRFEKEKVEVTIELIEVSVPIPVTINAELVKILKKAE